LGAWCEAQDNGALHLHGLLGDAQDGSLLRAEARGDEPAALGREVARLLREQGADALLRS
ncbi:MAG: hydroxymethylbilane synthase, partial [Rhodanobacteraceae bacterium]